jgi:hypothetical protein
MIHKQHIFGAAALLALPALVAGVALAQPQPQQNGFADPAFRRVWERTDLPVADHTVARTWFWGPSPNTPGLVEPNKESPNGQRLVQYFDKSRMEINNPAGNPNDQFFVTNGLLTVELISGRMQVGESSYETRYPACIPTTGDSGDTTAPTYNAMQKVSNTTLGDHPAGDRMGQVITATIDRLGNVGSDPAKAVYTGTKVAYFDTVTNHNIPGVFWTFLNESGPVYENGVTSTAQLINPWYYASGRPISEAYWTRATIDGKITDVMIQMYERRALTYVPSYTAAWQVEMANIGQHYYDWRYRGLGNCNGTPQPTVQPTIALTSTPGTSGTAVATGTAGATGTAVATGTAGATGTAVATGTVDTPTPTITLVVPPATVVEATPPTDTQTPTPSGSVTMTPTPIGTRVP